MFQALNLVRGQISVFVCRRSISTASRSRSSLPRRSAATPTIQRSLDRTAATKQSSSSSITTSQMDIRAGSFDEALPSIIDAINKAEFVAIDFEFSGVTRYAGSRGGKQTIQDRYTQDRIGVEKFQVMQMGLCTVENVDEPNQYILRPYTFPICPYVKPEWKIEREYSVQASAMHFLRQNGFDLNTIHSEGIPYLSIVEEAKVLASEESYLTGVHEDIKVDAQSVPFVENFIREIEAWIENPKPDYDYLNISGPDSQLNGYQRRLVHQTVRAKFPHLRTEGRSGFVHVTKFDADMERLRLEEKRARVKNDVDAAVGLRKVVDALRGKTKMLVGHNVLIDLMHLYNAFVGPLPHDIHDFTAMVHKDFPCILDTKYVASSHGAVSSMKSSLPVLSETIRPLIYPHAVIHPDHRSYIGGSCAHDAGFDTYSTAVVLLKLINYYQTHRKTALGADQAEKDAFALEQMNEYIQMMGTGAVNGQNEFPKAEDPVWGPFMNILRVNGTSEGLLRLDGVIKAVEKAQGLDEHRPAQGGGVLI